MLQSPVLKSQKIWQKIHKKWAESGIDSKLMIKALNNVLLDFIN